MEMKQYCMVLNGYATREVRQIRVASGGLEFDPVRLTGELRRRLAEQGIEKAGAVDIVMDSLRVCSYVVSIPRQMDSQIVVTALDTIEAEVLEVLAAHPSARLARLLKEV
jgi:hypothetical protein